MRQQQRPKQHSQEISEAERVAATFTYNQAMGRAMLLLLGGLLVLGLVLRHFEIFPFHESSLESLARVCMFTVAFPLIGSRVYAGWACKRKGVSLASQESTIWRRKPTAPMEALAPFGIGSKGNISRVAGALGVLLCVGFLSLLTSLLGRGGISPRPDLPLIRYVLGMVLGTVLLGILFVLGGAGLLISLTALRSAGELVVVNSEGISWVRGGKRHFVPWTKLAHTETTRGYDVKGELVKLEIRLFDNEDELQGSLSFGETRPASLPRSFVPWFKELADFATELQATFDTPR